MIKPGDAVEVIKSCCPKRVNPARFVVGRVMKHPMEWEGQPYCIHCMEEIDKALSMVFVFPVNGSIAQPIEWVRKYDPPAVDTTVPTNETIEA